MSADPAEGCEQMWVNNAANVRAIAAAESAAAIDACDVINDVHVAVSQKGWGEAYTQSGFALRILVHIRIQRQTRTSNQNLPCSALSLSNAHSNFAHSGPGQPSSTSILFHALCQGAVACTHYFRASVAVEQSNCVAISKTK